jgi:hypothetical protein
MKKDKIFYWVATSFVILFIGLGSFADLFIIDPIKESFKHIGFPEYMIPFFGLAKLFATLAILVPALKRFKEAAYAGLIYYFIGACYCHIAVGDGTDKYGITAFILATVIISFFYSNKINNLKHEK